MKVIKHLKLYFNFLLIGSLLIGFGPSVHAQNAKAAFKDSVLTAKNFPLLSMLKENGIGAVGENKVLKNIRSAQRLRTAKALKSCSSVSCYADALKWTETEINTLGSELIGLYQKDRSFQETVRKLRQQGSYALYDSAADTALVRSAWNDAAKGINRIFDVYIKGEKPRYAKIDSISFKPGDAEFKNQLQSSLKSLTEEKHKTLFFQLPLQAALKVLEINGRDEAARYEPLNGGLNQRPYEKIKSTDFAAYPYSLILIPGLGPEVPGMALEPRGAERCKEGAAQWKKGLAPFIVVSGGNVHPFQTPFNEAEEMKKYMVEELNIPAEVIFIEPHARHTTTNLRNTSRIIYRFGIPAAKPVLIVTDASQSSYITTGRMGKTAVRDFGYEPYKDLKKITDEETEFYPVWNSMQADPFDPLDP